MFDWKEFERSKNILSEAGNEYQDILGQHHIFLRPKNLQRWLEIIKDDLNYNILVDINAIDRLNSGSPFRLELVYHFLNMGTHQRLNLHLLFDEKEIVPSISGFYANADWLEREQKEFFNIQFGRPMEALLLPQNQENWPLRKDSNLVSWPGEAPVELPRKKYNPNKSEAPYPEEAYEWKKYELLSPVTGGNFEWQVCFDPVRVVESRVHIGFHHQGLEKLLENKDWMQSMHLVDIIHPGAAPTYSILWTKCLEEVFRIDLPERAQAIRIVLLEMARIADHLTILHEMTYALKHDEYRHFLNAREKIFELLEKVAGHRQGLGMIRLGGVKEDLPHGWIIQYQEVAAVLNRSLSMINKSLVAQAGFRDSLMGPTIDASTILKWGVSGPIMRASGLNFDLRKSQPFYFYQDIDFDIPVGITGTAYDRYLIYLEEVFQSIRIITQVLDNLPLGEIVHKDLDLHPLELMQYIQGREVVSSFHTSTLESPNGEAGFSLVLAPDLRLERVKMKTPSFTVAQALPLLVLGLQQDQLAANVASFGIRRIELDR